MIDASMAQRWIEAGFGIALGDAEADRLAGLIAATPGLLARQSADLLVAAGSDALFLTSPDDHARAMRAAIAAATR